jgi:hypothetical protein
MAEEEVIMLTTNILVFLLGLFLGSNIATLTMAICAISREDKHSDD